MMALNNLTKSIQPTYILESIQAPGDISISDGDVIKFPRDYFMKLSNGIYFPKSENLLKAIEPKTGKQLGMWILAVKNNTLCWIHLQQLQRYCENIRRKRIYPGIIEQCKWFTMIELIDFLAGKTIICTTHRKVFIPRISKYTFKRLKHRKMINMPVFELKKES